MKRRCHVCRQEGWVEDYDNTMEMRQRCAEKEEQERLKREAL